MTDSSRIALLDSLEKLDRCGPHGRALKPGVGCQERHVQFRGELDEQSVIHPEILPSRQRGSTFQPVSGCFVYDDAEVINDADRSGELLHREPPSQQALLPQDTCDLDPGEIDRLNRSRAIGRLPLKFPGMLEPVLVDESAEKHAGVDHVSVSHDLRHEGAGAPHRCR